VLCARGSELARSFSYGGMYWLSRIPVHGSFLSDLLPGMLVLSVVIGPVFVGVSTAANAGVSADKAGLAASLLNASQQVGGALGLAIFTAIATSRSAPQLRSPSPRWRDTDTEHSRRKPMYTQENSKPPLRELDRRANNGIVVRLLWNAGAGRVSVAVQDTRAGDSLEFEVEGSDALAAFHHPYAYAPATSGNRALVY